MTVDRAAVGGAWLVPPDVAPSTGAAQVTGHLCNEFAERGPVSLKTMSFFEPLPPEPAPQQDPWSPPLWDRPSDGTIPAPIAIGEVIYQGDDTVVSLETLDVYPNGFTINLFMLSNPHHARDRELALTLRFGGPNRWPRVGVRFPDGRTGGKGQWSRGPFELPKDADGFPTEIYVGLGGGAGGSGGWRFRPWVYPLPPEGPVEIFVGLPTGPDEVSITVDGSVIRSAAGRAKVIWS
jgi:hypothetical protein